MLIIWGYRRTAQRLAMVLMFCQYCNGGFSASLEKIVTKFTLFFIPLFPIHIKHTVTCMRCGAETKISKADADQYQQQQAQQIPQQPQEIPGHQQALPAAQQQLPAPPQQQMPAPQFAPPQQQMQPVPARQFPPHAQQMPAPMPPQQWQGRPSAGPQTR